MAKRTTSEVIERLLDALSARLGERLTIQDVSNASGVNWETTKNYLEMLVKLNVVMEANEGGKTFYQKIIPEEKDTFFRIPLKSEHKNKIKEIYATIKMLWPKGLPPSRTRMQKIAVEIVEKNYPDIPRGWYLYGEILLLPSDVNLSDATPFTSQTDVQIVRDACEKFFKAGDNHAVQQLQYQDKKNELYMLKDRLYSALSLSCHNRNPDEINNIRKMINDFAVLAEKDNSDSRLVAIVEEYCASVLSIFRNSDKKQIEEAQTAITYAFNQVWGVVATFEFYNSLSEFYLSEFLDYYFASRFEESESVALDALEMLRPFEPKIEAKTEAAKKLLSLMGASEEISEEEKKKREKELEHLSDSELSRMFRSN